MGVLGSCSPYRLAAVGLGWAVPAYLALAFICVVLAVIDASTRLLPNRITYPAFPVMLGLLLLASIGLGDLGRLVRGLLAAVAVGAFFLALALISPRGMGLGDVKLAPTLGLALGWLSWGAVAFGIFTAFLLGGLAGLAAIGLPRPHPQVAAALRSLAGHRRPARRPGRRGRGRLVRGDLIGPERHRASGPRSRTRPGCRPRGAVPLASAPMLRYLTAGESHGQALVAVLEGLPSGCP